MTHRPTPDERRFRALASASLDHIAEVDAQGRTVYVSPNHENTGDVGPFTLERVHPDDRREIAGHFISVLRDGDSRRATFRVVDPGCLRWVEVTMTPLIAEDGSRHALVLSRDITEARLTEERLRRSRERFQLIAENAYDMISEVDAKGRLLYTNERVWKVLGYGDGDRPSDAIGLIHGDDLRRVIDALRRVRDGALESAQLTLRVRRADGSWCWVDLVTRATRGTDGQRRMLGIARDVSARVETEQRLRESEQRYRDLVEGAPLGIVVVQGDSVVYANQATATIAGAAAPSELVGADLYRFLEPGEAATVARIIARGSDGRSVPRTLDLRVRRLDGELRSLHVSLSVISYGGSPAFQAIVRDVTELERSHLEQQRLELQLQEARKLESLGVLAGGIAHDFNNLLAVILSSVRYASSQDTGRAHRGEALRDAEEAAQSAARLVKQLLAYAGRRSPEVRDVDLSELSGSLVDLLGTAMSGSVELRLDLDPDPLPVHADVVQLEQVLMNLVLNAAHAVGEGPGVVTVRTHRRRVSRRELGGWLGGEDLSAGVYACLEVEDTGIGMDAETQARMFDPFFTTKAQGHGLGLSAVLGLVRGHRGAIDVRSAPGEGTRFRVALPTRAAVKRRAGDASRALVLLADADPERRCAAAGALRADAIQVLEASDAGQVLDLWALYGEELDAAVIDADLSDPDGPPLSRALRADRPELPIVSLHAHGREPNPHGREQASAFLAKPYAPGALREQIARLLEKGASGRVA